jgi:hypothetical protein
MYRVSAGDAGGIKPGEPRRPTVKVQQRQLQHISGSTEFRCKRRAAHSEQMFGAQARHV